MLKRILSCILVAALTLTALPMTAFAKTNDILYGDVNVDGEIDLNDALMLKRYIAEENPAGFSLVNADVNVDKTANMADLLMLKKYLAEWDILLGPALLTVSFYDGDRLIDTLPGRMGLPLGQVPATEKTSKANAVFAGWYTDPGFTKTFYADTPLTGDTKVYAKYDELKGSELTVNSFAQMDMDTDASFHVVGSGDIDAIKLIPKDGSDPVELSITGSGPYTVTAKDGFKEGASYELKLPEGMNFVGTSGETLPETVRTASFTIKKEAVNDLQIRDDVHYVQNVNPSALKEGSTVALTGAKAGDLICFYKTTNPKDRDYESGNAYMDDPETWFKVGAVNNGTVTLEKLDESDSEKMYEVPDNFPVTGNLPTGSTGTLTLDGTDSDGYALDTSFYKQMVEDGVTADLNYANQKVSVGDYISIYVSAAEIDNEDDIYFGKITAYDSNTGKITYIKSSAEEIESSMDLYVQPVLEGDDLLSEEAKEQIEETVLEQVKNSGFAEEAGFMLADMATRTDGFRNMDGVQMLLTGEDGKPLSDEEIALLNLGKSFELKDGIELKVEIVTSGDQLHFKDKGAVQLGIGIDAKFEVEVEDGGKVVIDLSATFVQELSIGVTAIGELVKKRILGIPIPIGVKIGSSVDLLSYTGVRVDVHAYTVAEEDKNLWEQLQEAVKNPEKIAELLPDSMGELKKGLETAGDVLDKIDEVKGKLEQVRDNVQKVQEYTDDLIMLWDVVEQVDGMPTEEEWEEMGKTLGKTNVSKDLMDMLDLSTETELDADRYADGLEGLLTKYSEMLEKKTDWVKLVQKEICQVEINICGLVIYTKADFVVRADMNIAMGTSLQYQVGKRYSFWLKIGLFKPQAGSSTMDLVDEEFTFQFYVMGKLGIKMGVEATAGIAIGSADFARVGVHLELGPYVKLYGFFIYEYERTREANTSVWISDERMAGALYLEFGLYLIVGIDAAALNDLFEVSHDFVDAEFPLLEAGERQYPYAFNYKPMEDELVLVEDEDDNSNTGITMTLPEEYRAVSYCNLQTGSLGATIYDWSNYNVTLSNPAFSMDENGKISVEVPPQTRYMECDLTLTYKYGKLAFSQYDMQVTIPLAWTNLATDEINQYYTASVRVGNTADGYDIVWSQRVRKNQEFTLPTEAELKTLIGYDDARYSSLDYPAAGQTKTIIVNTSYDCDVDYTDYAVTVEGIQNADGATRSETFHTAYGGTFDFSPLANTGTDKAGDAETASYTRFAGVSTTATVEANGQTQVIDLTQPITGKVAEAILNGSVFAAASYGDDSVLVTYTFSGIEAEDYSERIRKGTRSTYDFHAVVAEKGSDVISVTPAFGPVSSATTYYVECAIVEAPEFTITFEENGGSEVENISLKGGSVLGNLPLPTKTGYTFGGWFTNAGLTQAFTETLMPMANTTLYARWTANEYAVTLNVNGGSSWQNSESPVTVTYNSPYGTLPAPAWDEMHAFLGWFTAADGGTQVTEDAVVAETGDHVLYAHWRELIAINDAFNVAAADTVPYDGQYHTPTITGYPADSEGNELAGFTVRYRRKDNQQYIEGEPIDAGIYHVMISRPADDTYAKFESYHEDAVTITTPPLEVDAITNDDVIFTNDHFSGFTVKLKDEAWEKIHTDHRKTTVSYNYMGGTDSYDGEGGILRHIIPIKAADSPAQFKVTILVEDVNYSGESVTMLYFPVEKYAPTGGWKASAEEFTVTDNAFTITTPGQLAYLASALSDDTIRAQYNSSEITYTLGADLDMSAHRWNTVIGKSAAAAFAATFDGNGHTVSGLYSSKTLGKNEVTCSGLFGYVTGTVKNLNIDRSYFYVLGAGPSDPGKYCGAIAAVLAEGGTIENCKADVRIDGGKYARIGGIVGYLEGGTVTGCTNQGFISVEDRGSGGGIAGYTDKNGNTISYCTNTGTVTKPGGYGNIGGILGEKLSSAQINLTDNTDQGILERE